MTARLLAGGPVADAVLADVRLRAEKLRSEGITPSLATILGGDDDASAGASHARRAAPRFFVPPSPLVRRTAAQAKSRAQLPSRSDRAGRARSASRGLLMSTKNLARTVIEGGRTGYSRQARRHSHTTARARSACVTRQLGARIDPDSAVFLPRPQVWKDFDDKLGPARRWLRSQAGRPWNKVRSELFARFDTRTTAGRHIVFDHLLKEVIPSGFRSWLPELWISAHGILRYEARARPRRRRQRLQEPEPVVRAWLAGRRVVERGARLYWLIATSQGGFRQDRELSTAETARFRALPDWFRQELEGAIRFDPEVMKR